MKPYYLCLWISLTLILFACQHINPENDDSSKQNKASVHSLRQDLQTVFTFQNPSIFSSVIDPRQRDRDIIYSGHHEEESQGITMHEYFVYRDGAVINRHSIKVIQQLIQNDDESFTEANYIEWSDGVIEQSEETYYEDDDELIPLQAWIRCQYPDGTIEHIVRKQTSTEEQGLLFTEDTTYRDGATEHYARTIHDDGSANWEHTSSWNAKVVGELSESGAVTITRFFVTDLIEKSILTFKLSELQWWQDYTNTLEATLQLHYTNQTLETYSVQYEEVDSTTLLRTLTYPNQSQDKMEIRRMSDLGDHFVQRQGTWKSHDGQLHSEHTEVAPAAFETPKLSAQESMIHRQETFYRDNQLLFSMTLDYLPGGIGKGQLDSAEGDRYQLVYHANGEASLIASDETTETLPLRPGDFMQISESFFTLP